MLISHVFKDFKGRKGGQVERRAEGEGTKRVALQMSLTTCRCPGLFPGLPGREEGNSVLPETRQHIPDQNQNLSSLLTGGDQAPTLRSG